MELNYTKHEISMGRMHNGNLERALLAGHAFLNEGESFYTVKLMMFPGQSYFLVRNRDGLRYTLFAKLVKNDQATKFQNPVGSATLLQDASFIELYFPLLRTQLFMSLYPSNR